MGSGSGTDPQLISMPSGGGAQRGIGETFAPDLQTGTGNFTVPIAVPTGRNGFQPRLELVYSTGQGNGPFGLGWALSVPGVTRKTAKGVPRYRDGAADTDEWDTFILSGAEDLVPLPADGRLWFRPRTEGLFARIERLAGDAGDYWLVRSGDGLRSRYGTPRPQSPDPTWYDPAVISDPADHARVLAWKLTETEDAFGNRIVYDYRTDRDASFPSRWTQSYLERVSYVDYDDAGQTSFLVSVTFAYEARPDVFSDHRAGFEIRTGLRCSAITVATHAGQERKVRSYELAYEQAPLNGVSLLRRVELLGSDGVDRLPPLEFGYTTFAPDRRRELLQVSGADPPPASLARPDYALADISGDGLPDVLQMDGTVRYWRNLGGGRFDRPRSMREAPAGVALADPGVQLMDADGDGRIDVVVSRNGLAGSYPLRFDGHWGRFRPYRPAPTFSLEDPETALVDLDGDGVPDLVRAGPRLACAFNNPDEGRWEDLRLLPPGALEGLPGLTFSDPRVRWADLSGDGLQDFVIVHNGTVQYWPNLGHGRWASPVTMRRCPRFPWGFDPRRVLLGDVDGDGLADLLYVEDRKVTLWINQSGYAWSEPVEISGTPPVSHIDAVRLVDLLGSGIRGVLWTFDRASGLPRANMQFLDLTGAAKPYLLARMENHLGAETRVEYRPSTVDCLRDGQSPKTRWRTPLPFPVQVVARVEVIDAISRGKLTTEYCYHHGYWDGGEREFRGFGMVEQFDSEDFDRYSQPGLHGGVSFATVPEARFSYPTLTKTWFHLGPVGDEFGEWDQLDYSAEFWSDDPPAFARHPSIPALFSGFDRRRDRRDALRALRGQIVRTELYAVDGSPEKDRPYTVVESQYGLREESALVSPGPTRPRIFFPYLAAQRTTQWERGDDPLHQVKFVEAYDAHGQPTAQTIAALPRRSARRQPVTGAVIGTLPGDDVNETRILATHTRTVYASPGGDLVMHNRVSHARTFELKQPPGVAEHVRGDLQHVLADQWVAAHSVAEAFMAALAGWQPGQVLPGALRLVGHVVNHYDGDAFVGLPAGELGSYGALTRSEALVFRSDEEDEHEDDLDRAYGERRPAYIGGPAALPTGAPTDFGADLGYRHQSRSADGYHDGYYADTLNRQLDVQAAAAAEHRGLVLATRDPLGHEVVIVPDAFWLVPAAVTDPAGLTTTAEYDSRTLLPHRVIDANDNDTHYVYTPLGLLQKVISARGTPAKPEVEYSYDFGAYDRTRGDDVPQPIWVSTRRRVRHAEDGGSDETIESREYSDGFGRLIQKRVQADELLFGSDGDDAGLLVNGEPVAGQTGGPAVGQRAADRVAVSGWQAYDNKGRVVERYEPCFAMGWLFQPDGQAKCGQHVTLSYDPRGQLIRTVSPDGSELRLVLGRPPAPDLLDDLDAFLPTPWESYTYDPNDLAPVSLNPDGTSLGGEAPIGHHFTPSSTIADALGRVRCQTVRNGADPARDWFVTRSEYDTLGNVLVVRDALGRTAFQHAYDAWNRQLQVESIDAGLRTSIFDAAGNLVEYRDSKGATALRQYDRLNRPVAVWARNDAHTPVTLRERLVYGDDGDPEQSATARAYHRARNRLGRLHRHYDEAGLLEHDWYDFKGNLTDKARHVISDDALGAGWLPDWAASDASSALDATTYRTTTSYDALNRPNTITYPEQVAAPTAHRATLVPSYSRSGALQRIELDGQTVVERIAYNARGQRVLVVHGNGVMTRHAYDRKTFRLVRLRSERVQDPTPRNDTWQGHGLPLQDFTYAYDLAGNIVTIEDRIPGCGVTGSAEGRDRLTRDFTYDAIYRLIRATGRACSDIAAPRPTADATRCGSFAPPYHPGPPVPSQNNAPDLTERYAESYDYDPAGNLLSLRYRPTANSGGWTRRFGLGERAHDEWEDAPNNRLTSLRTSGDTETYQYDDNGNLAQQNTERHYAWDHADRLTTFTVQPAGGTMPSVHARYLYDAAGVRVKKWVRTIGAGDGDSTVYVDGAFEHHRWKKPGQVPKQHNTLHVMDGDERIALLRRGPAHDDDAGPPVQYHLRDHLGSSHVVIDDAGAWINREEYFAYGETSVGSYARKRYRFTGRERDEETGLAHHGVRYYAPWLTRWTSCDPVGPVDGPNLYAYALCSPVSLRDPHGRSSGTASTQSDYLPGGTPLTPAELTGSNQSTSFVNSPVAGVVEQSGPGAPQTLGTTPPITAGPTAATNGMTTVAHPDLYKIDVNIKASASRTEATTTSGGISKDTVTRRTSSPSLSWSLWEASGSYSQRLEGSYDKGQELGLWSKETVLPSKASVLKLGLSSSGATLSLVEAQVGLYEREFGLLYGDWLWGSTADVTIGAPSARLGVGVVENTVGATLGVTAATTRGSVGANILGLNVSVFAEVNAGYVFGIQGGSETSVRAGVLGGGVTFGWHKGNDPDAGWGKLLTKQIQLYQRMVQGNYAAYGLYR